jgi:hypothetical protein
MKKTISILSVFVVTFGLVTVAAAGIMQNAPGAGNFGMMPSGYMGHPCYGGQPTEYCVKWVQGQWQPVQAMVPGRWEYRPVWKPGYPVTLYRPIPGYWQVSYPSGMPTMPAMPTCNQTQNSQCGMGQQGYQNGYFDPNGMWQTPQQYPQYQPCQSYSGCPWVCGSRDRPENAVIVTMAWANRPEAR